jgi:hypothetical protein
VRIRQQKLHPCAAVHPADRETKPRAVLGCGAGRSTRLHGRSKPAAMAPVVGIVGAVRPHDSRQASEYLDCVGGVDVYTRSRSAAEVGRAGRTLDTSRR